MQLLKFFDHFILPVASSRYNLILRYGLGIGHRHSTCLLFYHASRPDIYAQHVHLLPVSESVEFLTNVDLILQIVADSRCFLYFLLFLQRST